ncbi:MAG: acyltransferase family protein [Fibrobacterota bacterium]
MKRILYIDYIRIVLISLVVLHHLAISYAAQGTWYFTQGNAPGVTSLVFSGFLAFNQSFFMGFLFLISAYFTPASYDKKGFFLFIKDRLYRLGIPLLIYVIVIQPLLNHIVRGGFTYVQLGYFKQFIVNYDVLGLGPMWFIALLLVLDLLYAVIRICNVTIVKLAIPGDLSILIFAFVIAISNFVIRIWVPMSEVPKPLDLHFPFLTQYVCFFIAGFFAYRGVWFVLGGIRLWKFLAITLAAMIPAGLLLTDNPDIYFGGYTWYSLIFSVWEQLFGISIIVFMLTFFRDHVNKENRLLNALSSSSYATYVFHPISLIPATLILAIPGMPILLKFLLAAPIAVTLSFVLGAVVRKIPGFKKVFG